MSKIYEINNKKNNLNKSNEKKKFPYDYNKNKAYYEALNKNMNYNSNNYNYLKNISPNQSDVFKSKEKDYFINNNQINSNRKTNNIINYTNNFNNFYFKNNVDISNNLLSSTDTNGPFRYIRKNMNEPNLMELLMNK